MNKNLGINILILCFGLSSVNPSLAAQALDVPPTIVQPSDLSAVNLQMLELDRENQEQILAIQGLMDENEKLANAALAHKQNPALEKINKTIADSQIVSKYDELINLTENIDDTKNVGENLELKRDIIKEKYRILVDLKDEMATLNKNLQGEEAKADIDAINQQQQETIEILTQRLDQLDQRISRYDDALAKKDEQIAQLKKDLASAQSESATKDEKIKLQKGQVDFLKSELENKITEARNQGQQEIRMQQQALEMKAKDASILWLKQALAATQNKEEYFKLTSQKEQLAMEQIPGEIQKIKDDFARHFKEYDRFENAIGALKSQVSRLGLLLSKKQGQMDLLKEELENKIIAEKKQGLLALQIRDLKLQLQEKENQIAVMKTRIKDGQKTQQDADSLNQLLLTAQDKAEQLKQQLDGKMAESNAMSLMLSEYQKKLEDKNNAYNEQLGQILSAKNDQARAQKQIADLQIRLQEKEAQVIKIKKALYNLQSLNNPEDRESQAKDLSLSIAQQKTIDEKSKEVEYLKTELSLALKQSKGTPGSDEIDFLRKGYQDATAQLKQKNEMLLRIQVNADEYEKRFKEQSLEFKTLKQQLREAREEIRFQDEDLKSRGVKALQAQLKRANSEIKDLQMQIIQLKDLSKSDPLKEKLTQALDKMNEQGRVINELNQKLQDSAK